MSNRIEEIKKLIEQNQRDPFLHYALAMEYNNHGQLLEAHACFSKLGDLFPDYLPRYLMHGGLLIKIKRFQDAVQVLTVGKTLAIKQNNRATANELEQALDQALQESTDD